MMLRSFFVTVQWRSRLDCRVIRLLKSSLLVLPLILILSGCGGSDGGDVTPMVALTVNLFDQTLGLPPTGDRVKISVVGGGDNDFPFFCYQSKPDESITVDKRCGTDNNSSLPGSNQTGVSIIFGSLPTQRTYTLTHYTPADPDDGPGGVSCTVKIISTDPNNDLETQDRCGRVIAFVVNMDINTGIIP